MESVQSSRRHGRREDEEASSCLKSESDCAVFASWERLLESIAPLYLELCFRKFVKAQLDKFEIIR